MPELAVSDTGPALHLSEINSLAVMKEFDKIVISDLVNSELQKFGVMPVVEQALCGTLEVRRVKPSEITAQSRDLSCFMLHRADLSVAALAQRLTTGIVLTDDLELRKALESRGTLVVGSIGMLFRSLRSGKLCKDELRMILDRLFDGSTLYLSKGLKKHVIARLDALPDDRLLRKDKRSHQI